MPGGGSSSSRRWPGGGSSLSSPNSPAKPVLWTEQEGLLEERQQQQYNHQQAHRGHHRSNSDAFVNYTSPKGFKKVTGPGGDGEVLWLRSANSNSSSSRGCPGSAGGSSPVRSHQQGFPGLSFPHHQRSMSEVGARGLSNWQQQQYGVNVAGVSGGGGLQLETHYEVDSNASSSSSPCSAAIAGAQRILEAEVAGAMSLGSAGDYLNSQVPSRSSSPPRAAAAEMGYTKRGAAAGSASGVGSPQELPAQGGAFETWRLPGCSDDGRGEVWVNGCGRRGEAVHGQQEQLQLVRPCYSPVAGSQGGGRGEQLSAAAASDNDGFAVHGGAGASPRKDGEGTVGAGGEGREKIEGDRGSVAGGEGAGEKGCAADAARWLKQQANTAAATTAGCRGISAPAPIIVPASSWCNRFPARDGGSTASSATAATAAAVTGSNGGAPAAAAHAGPPASPGVRSSSRGRCGSGSNPSTPQRDRRTFSDLLLGRDRSCTSQSPSSNRSILDQSPGGSGRSARFSSSDAGVPPGRVASIAARFGSPMKGFRGLFGVKRESGVGGMGNVRPGSSGSCSSPASSAASAPAVAGGMPGACEGVWPPAGTILVSRGSSSRPGSSPAMLDAGAAIPAAAGSPRPLQVAAAAALTQQQLKQQQQQELLGNKQEQQQQQMPASPGKTHQRTMSVPVLSLTSRDVSTPPPSASTAAAGSSGELSVAACSPLRSHVRQLSLPGWPQWELGQPSSPRSPSLSVSPPPGCYNPADDSVAGGGSSSCASSPRKCLTGVPAAAAAAGSAAAAAGATDDATRAGVPSAQVGSGSTGSVIGSSSSRKTVPIMPLELKGTMSSSSSSSGGGGGCLHGRGAQPGPHGLAPLDASPRVGAAAAAKSRLCKDSHSTQQEDQCSVAHTAAATPGAAAAAVAVAVASPTALGAASRGGAGYQDQLQQQVGQGAAAAPATSRSQQLAEAARQEEAARQLTASGRLAEAEAASRRALGLLQGTLGSSHPNVVSSMSRLASILNRRGNAEEAEGLFRQVLNRRVAILGKEHPQSTMAANNLATCLYGRGQYAAAARLYKQALAGRQAALGSDSVETAACMNNLALCLAR